MQFEVLKSFLRGTLTVLEANDFPVSKFSCKAPKVTKLKQKILADMAEMILTNPNDMYFADKSLKIYLNTKFDVLTNVGNSSKIERTAVIDGHGVKTIGNHEIKQTRRFLRIGITESIPYTYYKRDPATNEILLDVNNKPIYEGFCIDFINEIARVMDFSFELVEPSSGKFGEKSVNGTFDGLIGDLVKGETDLIVAALKMTSDREEQIDFIAPYFEQTGFHIVMKKPVPDTSLFKFMTVLRLEVWLSILGALSVTAIVIWILEVFSPYSSRNYNYTEQCR